MLSQATLGSFLSLPENERVAKVVKPCLLTPASAEARQGRRLEAMVRSECYGQRGKEVKNGMVFRQPKDVQLRDFDALLHKCGVVGVSWQMGGHKLLDVGICDNRNGYVGI